MIKKRYIEKLGMELAPLGFGVFRLPMKKSGSFSRDVYELLDNAMEYGINYYDTAWNYLQGHSEELIRKALVERYKRDDFFIADKLPCWLCSNSKDFDYYIRIQLQRLGVETIDFYLLHALNCEQWERMQKLNVLDFLDQMKRDGIVRKVGFSFHDQSQYLDTIVKGYNWDFAQLQINYYDWIKGDISRGYEILYQAGIPCMTMETVRGGLLARLPDEADKKMKNIHPKWSQASWAFRFVSSLDNVAVMLSGMNTKQQLDDNVLRISELYENRFGLTIDENKVLKETVEIISNRNTNLCTGCNYCRDECPNGIRISALFKMYNEYMLDGDLDKFRKAYLSIPYNERADYCAFCKRCEKRCPQYISITDWLPLVSNVYRKSRLYVLKKKVNFERKMIIWGAGENGKKCIKSMQKLGIPICFVCDNNQKVWGKKCQGIMVISPKKLVEEAEEADVQIIVTVQAYYNEIIGQLSELGLDSKVIDWKIWEE